MITIQLSQQQQSTTTTTIITAENAVLFNNNADCQPEERPCEKYLQFMDSSRQERTFMIEKLVGKHYADLKKKKNRVD